MARSSTTFRKGSTGIGRKGALSKITLDQRAIFDTAIPPEDRVAIVQSVFRKAMLPDPKESAPFAKLVFQYIFSLPRVGHEVAVLDIEEVMSPEVCAGVWREISAEARLRDAKRKETPRLDIIEAEVVGTKAKATGNGQQTRNGHKKKNGTTRKS